MDTTNQIAEVFVDPFPEEIRDIPSYPYPSALDVQVGGDHYKGMKIQPVEFIRANNIPFIEGSIIKYVSRWRNKNGFPDLEKAKHFIDLLMDLERKYGKTVD